MLMAGYILILRNGLEDQHAEVAPHLAQACPPLRYLTALVPCHPLGRLALKRFGPTQSLFTLRRETYSNAMISRGIKAMALWFCVTGITALVAARRRDFSAHKVWVIRHVASGIWVSIMRAMIPLLHFAVTPLPPILMATNLSSNSAFGTLPKTPSMGQRR
jgi:hypothetical protein